MFGMGGSGPKPPAVTDRKPQAARKPALVAATVKLEPDQRDTFEWLGGEAWLREQLDMSRVSTGR